MGWASGSEIVREFVVRLQKAKFDGRARREIYSILVPILCNQDWDTQDEVIDMDEELDAVLKSRYPEMFEEFDE